MAFDKPIRRVAIVGTGVIGVSWAAEFLASGFDVIVAGPVASADANPRKYVDIAWTALGLALKKALGEQKEERPCLAMSHVS